MIGQEKLNRLVVLYDPVYLVLLVILQRRLGSTLV